VNVSEFKESCINSDPDVIVQKFIIDGPSYYFNEVIGGEEFEFKKEMANILNVHIRDIAIVGSGKLGFSLKPDDAVPSAGLYLFKKFDYAYELDSNKEKSDLDIAIVSSNLFDRELQNLFGHTGSYKTFIGKDRTDFAKYILKGRFMINYLPIDFQLTKEIELVQSKYKMKYGRDINLEIYKSWYFFETYHQDNVFNIKLNLLQ
jgi:hypothetical protein